jgi:hypothetical protein
MERNRRKRNEMIVIRAFHLDSEDGPSPTDHLDPFLHHLPPQHLKAAAADQTELRRNLGIQ